MKAERWTARIGRDLRRELLELELELVAVDFDRGMGLQAVAAIAATPAGPARAVAAAWWARRAVATVDVVAYGFTPWMSDNEVDATTEFVRAVEAERGRAA